jgi:uncharacterized protein
VPLFAIHALDAQGVLDQRLTYAAAHRVFVDEAAAYDCEVVMSGPMQSDDGERMIGSLLIIDAPDRERADAFCRADPYSREGVWQKITITRFLRRLG